MWTGSAAYRYFEKKYGAWVDLIPRPPKVSDADWLLFTEHIHAGKSFPHIAEEQGVTVYRVRKAVASTTTAIRVLINDPDENEP